MPNLRPTYSRLPNKGYQDNPIADALTSFYDEKLVAVGDQIQSFHTLLDPATCPVIYLDFLAYLVGMVDPYYDTKWSVLIKRAMIAAAMTLFRTRGTKDCLVLALDIQGILYTLYRGENLKFAFTFAVTTKFGLAAQVVYVQIPTPATYPRTSQMFVEAQRAVRNYTAIAATVQVTYDRFYLGYSTFGEPLF